MANKITKNKFQELANELASKYDADVFLYSGRINFQSNSYVWDLCGKIKNRKNVILFLCTFGGEADAAYRIARCLQQKYSKFTINIHGFCKSAGTLIAIGADEIVMSDNGELGPLDVQLAKDDDILSSSSGLNIEESLDKLHDKTLESLEKYFLPIVHKSGGRISTKTAIQIASNLVIGLYGKIYEHVDPIQIGEVNRAMKIAIDYGKKLNKRSGILNENTIEKLVSQYCDHGFVIDREEAEILFKNVRAANSAESELASELGQLTLLPAGDDNGEPIICLLNEEFEENKRGGTNAGNDRTRKAKSDSEPNDKTAENGAKEQ